MLTRLIAVALLMLAAVPVLASDASYDQRNLAASSQTAASAQTKDSQPRTAACSCPHA